jgi:hypothetical protein
MDEDMLQALMTNTDPVRDLNDEALDELVPNDRLMARVLTDLGDLARVRVRQHVSLWRRVSFRVSATAATVLIVASGSVAIFGSSTSLELRGLALGSVHSTWLHAPLPSGQPYAPTRLTTTATSSSLGLVRRGRVDTTLELDGFTIAPAAISVHPTVPESVMANELWATTALAGTTQLALAYGDVTLNMAGAPKLRDVPVWVAIATAKQCNAKVVCNAANVASWPLTIVVSGYGLPSLQEKSGLPIDFVYQSAGTKSTAKPRLLPAIEEVSSPWIQDGPVKDRTLSITTGPFPCGALHGYSLVAGPHGATLTVESLYPESTMGDYCASSLVVHRAIALTATTNGVTRWLVNPSVPFVHATTGPMTAAKQ